MFQKFFASLFTYAIALQLMVGAIPNTPVSWVAYGQSCAAGLQWSSQVNRCLSTEQAARVKEASAQCDKAGDDAAVKQCYKGVIEGKLSEAGKGEKGEIKGGAMNMILPMASLASAAMFLMKGGPSDCPGASSAWLMMGGALAVIAGEVMSGMTYKKKIKAAQEKFEAHTKTSNGTNSEGKQSDIANSTSSQAEAFQAMIEMEEAVIAAAKQKNQLYMVATAAYAAAAAMSAYEIYQWGVAKAQQAYPPTAAQGIMLEKMVTCFGAAASTQPNIPGHIPASQYALVPQKNYSDLIDKSVSSELIETFLENHFIKGQRIVFKEYISANKIDGAYDFASVIMLNRELIAMKGGSLSSGSVDDYELLSHFVDENYQVFDQELGLMKIGTKLAQQFTVPSAHAMGDSIGLLAGAAGVGALAIWGPAAGLQKLYITPMSRLVLSGVMTVNNIFMIKKTNEEKGKAEDRKKFIEGLKQQVSASGAAFGCTSTDRSSNLSKPECYCYGENGQLNPSRSKSKTCEPYFGGKAKLASAKNSDIPDTKSCIGKKGDFDESCSCKSSNSCASIGPRVSGTNIPGAANLMGSLPGTIDGLNSGALSARDVDAAAMNRLAARSKATLDKLISDPKNKKLALQVKKAEEDGKKLMDNMNRQIAASNPSLAASSDRSSSFMGSTNPDDALEKMKQDLKQDIRQIETAAVPVSGGSAAAKKDDFSLDGLNVGGITIADEDLANQEKMEEIMAAQYEMGDSEINSDPGANIFQILTNRYQRSGMRRLFGAEKVVPADKPVEAPIAQ